MQRFTWARLVCSLALVGLAVVPAPAAPARPASHATSAPQVAARAPIGPVTLGRVAPTGTSACIADYLWLQAYSDPINPSYTVPFAGVVTSVRHFANSNPSGRIQAVFLRPTATDFVYDVASRSPELTLAPGQLNTVPVRIPVQAGEILAMRTVSGQPRCEEPGGTVDQDFLGGLDGSATTWGPLASSHVHVFVNISAVWEPDVDGDGYGDATQDRCPQLAAVHDPCPAPVTTVGKAPKKRTSTPRVKIKFTSDLAGSTFTCSVDGRAFKACRSPYKGRFPLGTHTVRITATSPVGVAAQPVTVQFKVVKPKR